MEAAAGMSLRFYAQRVLTSFLSSWKGNFVVDPEDWQTVQDSVDVAVRSTIDYTGETVRDLIRAAARRAEGGGPIVIEEGLTSEQKAYRRLTTGMSGVARILTTRAREEAKAEYATRVGAVGKSWKTRKDGRVRVSHADLEGDFVELDEPFVTVRGNSLLRPGDPAAPIEETINCRCRLSYRMPLEAAA